MNVSYNVSWRKPNANKKWQISMSLIHDRDTMEDFEEDAVEGRGKRRREMGYVSEAVRKQFLRIAAERESEIHRCDPKKIVTEALNDMDRVLDVTGVSKGLKSTLCTLKEAAGRTRGAVLHLAAEAQKQARRSNERDGIEKELEAKDSEINEL